jgi:uncharacterized LabA/DUF88 family protein
MRCGIFVDAGYVFAQGSNALVGKNQPRQNLTFDKTRFIDLLVNTKILQCPNSELLRVYWYDGASTAGPTNQHLDLAFTENVKVRLGFINSNGQQKGVDSLIVTDLIELARNRAIADAVLVSGDEDVRVGVTIAQNYGVRVHLVGIVPSRGSQSQLLLQEADTTTEWSREQVAEFLKLANVEQSGRSPSGETDGGADRNRFELQTINVLFESVATEVASSLPPDVSDTLIKQSTLPRDIDGRLLALARIKLGRLLNSQEKIELRASFRRCLALPSNG